MSTNTVKFVQIKYWSFLPTIKKPLRLISDGDFETISPSWYFYGTVLSSHQHFSGQYSAWLGGYINQTNILSQTITIPLTGQPGIPITSENLSYCWYMTTSETSHPWDYLYVQIRYEYGNILSNLETINDGYSPNTVFVQLVGLLPHFSIRILAEHIKKINFGFNF